MVEQSCPVFIVSPASIQDKLKAQLRDLHDQPNKFQWLADDLSLDEITDRLSRTVFDYGYRRRGAIPTINVSTRAKPNIPTSALLDLDWQSYLNTERHPTELEWNTLFVPALKNAANNLTGLKEATRIQVDGELPLPASVALGFYLNLRVAILGVWARYMGRSDAKQLWLSDGEATKTEVVETWFQDEKNNTCAAILELTSGFSIHPSVKAFVEQQGITADLWLQIHLPTNDDKDGIKEGQATTYANYIGNLMRRLTERGVTDSHLFLRLPAALGILVGQKLHACGRIHLYWFDNKSYSYKPAFTLA